VNGVGAFALVAAEKNLTEDTVRPGLIGLFFFVALFVATYFLWKSMNKQLKKVDAHFVEEGAEALAAATGPGGPRRDISAQEQIAIDQATLSRLGREKENEAEDGSAS